MFKLRRLLNPDLVAPLALTLLGLAFFGDFLFSSKSFYFRDILAFHFPLRRFLIDSYMRGELPLWNPFVYMGQPMLANPNYMAFYPTNLLHLVFSFNYAFKLHLIIHPLLAGLGAYFLQRRLGIGPAAAFAGSLVYEFSGAVLSFLNLYNIIPAIALLPWIGWAFLRALSSARRGSILLFGAVLSLQILAFEPLMVQCVLLLIAGLSFYYWLEEGKSANALKMILRAGFWGALFGFSLAAIQVIPALELLQHTIRGNGYDYNSASAWSLHPADLLNLIIPGLFGNPYTLNRSAYWGEAFHSGREAYLVSMFVGPAALLFVLISFWSTRRHLQRIVVSLAALSTLFALGQFIPLNHWLFRCIPFFKLGRYPSKLFLLGTLALAIAVSLGIEALRPGPSELRRRRPILAAAMVAWAMAVAVFGVWIYCHGHSRELAAWISAQTMPGRESIKNLGEIAAQLTDSLRWSWIFFLLSGAVLFLSSALKSWIFGSLSILVLAAELIPVNLQLSPLISGADAEFVPEVNRFLGHMSAGEPSRVFVLDSPQNLPAVRLQVPNRSDAWLTLFYRLIGQPFYGISSGIQYSLYYSIDDLNTKESEELFRTFWKINNEDSLNLLRKLNSPVLLSLTRIDSPGIRLLAAFNTGSILKIHVYVLDGGLGRIYFVSNAFHASSHSDALKNLLKADFPFKSTVILEDSGIPNRQESAGGGEARLLDYRSNLVRCEVSAATHGYLVLLDSYYPGWKAYVDGREEKILRANYAFRAVEVPAGKHQIEFRYRPTSFYIGFGITAFALLAAGAFTVFDRCYNRTSRSCAMGRTRR